MGRFKEVIHAGLATIMGAGAIGAGAREASASAVANEAAKQLDPDNRIVTPVLPEDLAANADITFDNPATTQPHPERYDGGVDEVPIENPDDPERQLEKLPMPTFPETELSTEEVELHKSLWNEYIAATGSDLELAPILASGGVADYYLSITSQSLDQFPDGAAKQQLLAAQQFAIDNLVGSGDPASFRLYIALFYDQESGSYKQIVLNEVPTEFAGLNPGSLLVTGETPVPALNKSRPDTAIGIVRLDAETVAGLSGPKRFVNPDGTETIVEFEVSEGQRILSERIVTPDVQVNGQPVPAGRGVLVASLISGGVFAPAGLNIISTGPNPEPVPQPPADIGDTSSIITTPEPQRAIDVPGSEEEDLASADYTFSLTDTFRLIEDPAERYPTIEVTTANDEVFLLETTGLRSLNPITNHYDNPEIGEVWDRGITEVGKTRYFITCVVLGTERLTQSFEDGRSYEFFGVDCLTADVNGNLLPIRFMSVVGSDQSLSYDNQNLQKISNEDLETILKPGMKIQLGTSNADAAAWGTTSAYVLQFEKADANLIRVLNGEPSEPQYLVNGVVTVAFYGRVIVPEMQ